MHTRTYVCVLSVRHVYHAVFAASCRLSSIIVILAPLFSTRHTDIIICHTNTYTYVHSFWVLCCMSQFFMAFVSLNMRYAYRTCMRVCMYVSRSLTFSSVIVVVVVAVVGMCVGLVNYIDLIFKHSMKVALTADFFHPHLFTPVSPLSSRCCLRMHFEY